MIEAGEWFDCDYKQLTLADKRCWNVKKYGEVPAFWNLQSDHKILAGGLC